MSTADRPTWLTSSWSSNGEKCVEVAPAADGVTIRHSKHPAAGTITFAFPAWAAFLRETCDDLPSANGIATITKIGSDTLVRSLHTTVELRFDEDEWSAFTAGAAAGEFDFAGELAAAT
ncbi:MAG: DUF397 domain-containing protein [Pseudonocardiaceae bacterium]|nr:DUF397 domain-containing protein [Pseudonocardiaceae bacterium]